MRTHGFLATILPYTDVGWERLSIFLNFLIPKLPYLPAATVGTTVFGISGQFPVNSRFGEINSRLTAKKFAVFCDNISAKLLIQIVY